MLKYVPVIATSGFDSLTRFEKLWLVRGKPQGTWIVTMTFGEFTSIQTVSSTALPIATDLVVIAFPCSDDQAVVFGGADWQYPACPAESSMISSITVVTDFIEVLPAKKDLPSIQ
jgi:hypothetical protein